MSPLVRPTWEDMLRRCPVYGPFTEYLCPCGQKVGGLDGVRIHWERGHFDYEALPTLGVQVAEQIQPHEKLA